MTPQVLAAAVHEQHSAELWDFYEHLVAKLENIVTPLGKLVAVWP